MEQSAWMWGVVTRLLAVVFLIHFLSATPQLLPLLGRHGVEPAHLLLGAVRRDMPLWLAWLRFPTLLWLDCSDRALWLLGVVGCVTSATLAVGLWGPFTGAAFLLLYVCWLSIQTVGSNQFSFPWDLLLNECALLGIFLPGLALLPEVTATEAPTVWAQLAWRWLLLRVMLGMGLAKFRVWDESTRNLTFIHGFLQWQPMPTWVASWARELPLAFHKAALVGLFVVEMILPLGIFGPAWMQVPVALAFVALQVGIALCGNFGVFNILTASLSLVLLTGPVPVVDVMVDLDGGNVWVALLLGLHAVASVPYLMDHNSWTTGWWLYCVDGLSQRRWARWRSWTWDILRALAPFRVVNAYGVFAPTGTAVPQRRIVLLEGSMDGVVWKEFEPRFLTCSVERRPPFFAPHQPRFDHFMFYDFGTSLDLKHASILGTNPYYLHPWGFREKLVQRLLRHDPVVHTFFRHVPFEEAPRFMRFAQWTFTFTTRAERQQTGNWWRRTRVAASVPMTLLELPEMAGIRDRYDRFIHQTQCQVFPGVNGLVDPNTGERVPIQLFPVLPLSASSLIRARRKLGS